MDKEKATREWDLIIEPQSSLFSLHLKDTWHYRDLLKLLVRRDFVSFYKQTILGPLWFFIQPLFTTITYVFVFRGIAGWSTDDLPAPLFYMTGIVAWNYFAECLTKTSTVFRDNANIFGKVYFPRLIMPLSIVLSNLVKFGIQLIILIISILYYIIFKHYHFHPNIYLLLFPYAVFILASIGLGMGMVVSALTTKYRDLAFLITFGVQLFMYATPVIYPLSSTPAKLRSFVELNPLSGIVETMRFGLLGKGSFSWSLLGYSSLFAFLMLFFGMLIFNRVEKNFVDSV
jgi:lipopolysaccharide transport system permease protein